ncbi:MAG: dynamin family protein [Verrucomicrobiota bacterium]|nr:dynamin family protein [Verrucomicrobiota bacterium]
MSERNQLFWEILIEFISTNAIFIKNYHKNTILFLKGKMMKGKEFLESKWVKQGQREEGVRKVNKKYKRWRERVKNVGILDKAGQLWSYFTSSNTTMLDKGVVVGALLYLIAPFDLIPDFIPITGWLDDLGVASFALGHLNAKLSELALQNEIEGTEEEIIDIEPINKTPDTSNMDIIETENDISYKIPELKNIALKLDAQELLVSIEEVEQNLQSDYHTIVVAGRYTTGKSSLINALLGGEYLPVASTPTTKAITYIGNGKSESLFTENNDGTINHFSSIDVLSDTENQEIKNAKKIKLTLPKEDFLPQNVAIIDSPGIEDPKMEVSKLVYEVIPDADAIILVCDFYSLSKKEIEFINDLLEEDRERKLFIVLNKIDSKTEQEVEDKKEEIRDLIKNETGMIDSKIFSLSVKSALNKDEEYIKSFNQFKENLYNFICKGKKHAKNQRIQGRLSLLKQELNNACKMKLEMSQKSEEERKIALKELKSKEKILYEILKKEKNKLSRKINLQKEIFTSNMVSFKETLRKKLNVKIDSANLSELKTLDLSGQIKKSTNVWLEKQLQSINKELKTQANEIALEMKIKIAQTEMPIDIDCSNWLAENKQLILPGLIVVSFPMMGMFSWLYIAIGGMLGRNIVENLIQGIAEKFGAKNVRSQFKNELSSVYTQLWNKIDKQKEEYFEKTKQNIFAALEETFTESISSLKECVTLDSEHIDKERYENIQRKLENI